MLSPFLKLSSVRCSSLYHNLYSVDAAIHRKSKPLLRATVKTGGLDKSPLPCLVPAHGIQSPGPVKVVGCCCMGNSVIAVGAELELGSMEVHTVRRFFPQKSPQKPVQVVQVT